MQFRHCERSALGFDHETKFICDQCSSEFLSAKYLAQHIALTHQNPKKGWWIFQTLAIKVFKDPITDLHEL